MGANLTSRLFEVCPTFSLNRETFATPANSVIGYRGCPVKSNREPIMWIPTRIYEGLPMLYLTVGALLILGAVYIGVSYGLMPGYAILGLSCMIAGMLVRSIRRSARSTAEPSGT